VVTWEAEHPSVLAAVRRLGLEGVRVQVLPVDAGCLPDPEAIPADAGLISTSMANSEVGTLQPVAAIAVRAHEIGALLHVDCCQGARWLPPPVEEADLASFSGHKLGAGGGGLLYADRRLLLDPLQVGGPQEFGRRAGHLDPGLAAAVAAALEEAAQRRPGEAERVAPLAERLRVALAELGGALVGAAPRLPNVAAAAFDDRRGEDLLLALDLAGVAASSGAACAAGALDPSVVLLAMGRSLAEAEGSLRLSVGYETSAGEVDGAISILRATLRTRAASAGSGAGAAPSPP
jgi:cysteine desulfurase